MFENLFRKKDNRNVKNENNEVNEEFLVKDLYITNIGLVSYDKIGDIGYNREKYKSEPVIVEKINDYYVKDVLTGCEYGIFIKFSSSKLSKFVNRFMVSRLVPLGECLRDKVKKNITRQELTELLYPKVDQKNESSYRDVIVQEISKTLDEVNKLNISEAEKQKYRSMLLRITNYYGNSLENNAINNFDLRIECLRRLTEIKIMLFPEEINNSLNEVAELKEEIGKIKYIFNKTR